MSASHARTLPETWGSADDVLGEKLRLGVDLSDAGDAQLWVEYLPNGRVVTGMVGLDPAEGLQFALSVLDLTAEAHGCSRTALLEALLAGDIRKDGWRGC